ncbi:hypothetical protein PILCRDRAFT_810812 [Piloderma croceum F 1598]|uniref:Uncharacterized protein n=1 Tax=Piloderma croceum (strain F 1598) TaxID=765440 RepID=A0A0C3GLS2_PILCF|nr:hypothetical protein PILCRDRAFT_810812 [Piloderma croceum F 1598]
MNNSMETEVARNDLCVGTSQFTLRFVLLFPKSFDNHLTCFSHLRTTVWGAAPHWVMNAPSWPR